MELELEYFMSLLVKEFYEENQSILCETDICNGQKDPPCNCLTGLSVNYWGYVVRNCHRVSLENTFDVKNGVYRILTTYKGKRIIPVAIEEKDSGEYLLSGQVCVRAEVSPDKIYLQRNFTVDLPHLDEQIPDQAIERKNRVSEIDPIYDFLSRFIYAVRIRPIENESTVLFAIMLFFFPNRTMRLVRKYMNDSMVHGIDRSYIKDFITKYDGFLTQLSFCNEHGFFHKFYAFFEELTGVYVGEWIEKAIENQENKKFWKEALHAAYNRNVEEKKRRSSLFGEVLNS